MRLVWRKTSNLAFDTNISHQHAYINGDKLPAAENTYTLKGWMCHPVCDYGIIIWKVHLHWLCISGTWLLLNHATRQKLWGSYLWQMCISEPALRVRADALLLLKQFMHVLHTHSLFVCVCACMCMTVYIQDLIRTSMYSHYHHTHIHIYNHHHIVWYKVVVVVVVW